MALARRDLPMPPSTTTTRGLPASAIAASVLRCHVSLLARHQPSTPSFPLGRRRRQSGSTEQRHPAATAAGADEWRESRWVWRRSAGKSAMMVFMNFSR
jgi:hypothetical protein